MLDTATGLSGRAAEPRARRLGSDSRDCHGAAFFAKPETEDKAY